MQYFKKRASRGLCRPFVFAVRENNAGVVLITGKRGKIEE
jgi:hypothetical protein